VAYVRRAAWAGDDAEAKEEAVKQLERSKELNLQLGEMLKVVEEHVDGLLLQNQQLKLQLKQLAGELDLERKLREKERKEAGREKVSLEKNLARAPASTRPGSPPQKVPGTGKLSLSDKVLLCLFQVNGALTRNQITFYTGMSPTSGPMSETYARLLAEDLVRQPKKAGPYAITNDGVEHLMEVTNGTIGDLPSGNAIYEAFCQREGGNVETMARAVLQLFRTRSGMMSRAQVAEIASKMFGRQVSATSGPASEAFGRLMKLGVTEGKAQSFTLARWVVGLVEPVSVKVRDTSTGEERRVTVK
jgi:hypothetical protein